MLNAHMILKLLHVKVIHFLSDSSYGILLHCELNCMHFLFY